MAVNGKGKGLRWFLSHSGHEGWTICGERGMLRATAWGARGKSGDSLMFQGLEQEQQFERKKSLQVETKRGAETSVEK